MAILFDCHSMPHDALNAAMPRLGRGGRTWFSATASASSCDRWLIEARDATSSPRRASPSRATRRSPAATSPRPTAGRARGVQALQIEIDRALYMDEARVERLPEFDEIAARIGRVVAGLAALGPRPVALPVAAE